MDEIIAAARALSQEGNLPGALKRLEDAERHSRTNGEVESCTQVTVAAIQLCFDARDWELLNQKIVYFSKVRTPIKQAFTEAVRECMKFFKATPDEATQIALIETLRTVTEGKIHVEIERVRLTKLLAEIQESRGDIAAACKTLQEIQIETVGSLDKRERAHFLLEQIRLCFDHGDFIRGAILARKVNLKTLEEDSFKDLKVKFYQEMVRQHTHNAKHLETCRAYLNLAETKDYPETDACEAVARACLYLLLAPYEIEQDQLMRRCRALKRTTHATRDVLGIFLGNELIGWTEFCAKYQSDLQQTHVFCPASDPEGKLWETLRDRVMEHDIRSISWFYSNIHLARMAQLLNLTEAECETALSRVVVSKMVYARIDRPAGIVTFEKPCEPTEVLAEWSSDVDTLLAKLGHTCHLIAKERMLDNLRQNE